MPRRNNQPKLNQRKIPSLGNMCGSKQRFPTEKQANKAADDQMLTDFYLQLDVYRCEFCKGWHLTSNSHL